LKNNIFEILRESLDFHSEVNRINILFNENTFCETLANKATNDTYEHRISADELFEKYLFSNWKQRNRCVKLEEVRDILRFEQIVRNTNPELKEVLSFLEYVLNIWTLSRNYANANDKIELCGRYTMLEENMNSFLDDLNHEFHFFEAEEKVLICEKNSQVTAVADIVDTETAMKVVRYNHFLLKGDMDTKKNIIFHLSGKLEPKRKRLTALDKEFSSNLFSLFNNLNLRHNNKDKEDEKKYNKVVAKMRKSTLEKWYDEAYQMALLAFLLLDNVKRSTKVVKLNERIKSTKEQIKK
jgi:hypothetical protein